MNVPLVIVAFLVLVIGAIVIWKLGLESASIACAAVPVGIVIYFALGISIARTLERGRFYSVPFGGFKIGGQDWALVASGSFWIVFSFVVIRAIVGKRPWKP